ncbi:gamma-glutamylcyclotransferase [Lujinxingia vulgaris]|mgnify:FL=1|uniref:Gamma-glutamylcyclotransferase n=1 Tax=Lujinxingia vulgaris TaxID=2600176 RepID=A0A5C6XIE6_9DELT|nr:gamma-glutamylcyclotransferase family protein [Lujinxingia vulgaris]TXD39750.1 gamma-glutamylcyclotransferase [Lujinxingia vulgaris]
MATVVRDREGRVPGLVWAVSADDLERLDRCEGHPFAYRRKRLLVDTGEARRRRVHVYVKDDAEQALPTEAYLGVIWRAYRRHGFDEHGLSLALGGER